PRARREISGDCRSHRSPTARARGRIDRHGLLQGPVRELLRPTTDGDMIDTGLGAVIFLTCCIIVVFGPGAFLVHRVMTRPGTHIGSRLPKHDPHAEADPTDPDRPDPDDGPE